MKRIKSYKEVWSVGGSFYFPITETLSFRLSFVFIGMSILAFGVLFFTWKYIPYLKENSLFSLGFLPLFFGYFMDKRSFEEKRPHRFLLDVIKYLVRGKRRFGGERIKREKWKIKNEYLGVIVDGRKEREEEN